MLEIISAKYLEGYKIALRFNNGEAGTVDLKDALWGPVFEPLRNLDAFQKFEVSDVLHTIRWENDADLAPEFLYERMVEQASASQSADARR